MSSIYVTNETEAPIKGRFAGQDYVFPVGESVAIDIDTARHLFGFGESDKSLALQRLGWLAASEHYDAAVARLGKLTFGAEANSAAGPSGNVGPLVNAGEVEGDGEAKVSPSPKTTRLRKGSEPIN